MKRLMVLSILIIVILLLFNSVGCQQKTESDTAQSPTTTPTPVPTPTPTPTPTPEPTPTPTETGSTCDQKLLSYNIPLSFRKSGELIALAPWESPELEDASSEPQLWCFYHTPEALPTMRNYFNNQGLGNGWSKIEGEGFDEVEESLSYWTRDTMPDGAMVWMKPKEPGTFIAIAIYTKQ